MEVLSLFTGLLPLLFLGLIVWLILRATGRIGSTERTDPGVMVRRFVLLGLLFVAVMVAIQGLIQLSNELLAVDERSNSTLARSMAFLIVGTPVFALLARHVDRTLRDNADERHSLAWTIYLNGALLSTLIAVMVETHAVLAAAIGAPGDQSFENERLVAAVIWGVALAGHWFYFRTRYPPTGDIELATGTLAGLIALAVGLGGVVYVAADELYTAVTDDPLIDRAGPPIGWWTAAAIVGAAVWGWYWLARYRVRPRTDLWYVIVVPIGALAGFVATVVAVANVSYIVAVWWFGDPASSEAVRHFDNVPALCGVLTAGALSWTYHRSLLKPGTERNDAIRSYDYLLSAGALVTGTLGLVVLLAALVDIGHVPVANSVIAGVTMTVTGLPIWLWFWTQLGQRMEVDPDAELGSPLRRVYLFSLFGVGGLATLISLLVVLTISIEDVLDRTLSRETLHDVRIGLAVVVTVSGLAWYHFRIFQRERNAGNTLVASAPRPTGRPPRIVVVSPDQDDLVQHLTDVSGASVVHWHRTDCLDAAIVDTDRLVSTLSDYGDDDLLILVGARGTTVIPLAHDDSEADTKVGAGCER